LLLLENYSTFPLSILTLFMKSNLSSAGLGLLLFFLIFGLPQCSKPLDELQLQKTSLGVPPKGRCPYDCHDPACKAYASGYCGDPAPPPPPPPRTITFRGIRPGDLNGTDAIDNPERGFRFYFALRASNLTDAFSGADYSGDFTAALQGDETAYGSNKVRLVQLYFYLPEYINTPISSTAMANMQRIFDFCKLNHFKVLLRFALRVNNQSGIENLGNIDYCLGLLTPLMQQNESVIYAVQAGFLGLWGEWHDSGLDNFPNERALFLRQLLTAVPASRKIQVRETAYKNATLPAFSGLITYDNGAHYLNDSWSALPPDQANRIGFHDDWFVLDQGSNPEWDYKYPDPDFFQVQTEGPNTTVDGEVPPTSDFSTVALGNNAGWYAARRMRAHGYTSFNIIGNWDININAWRNQLIYPSQFRADNTLVTDDYFLDNNGNETGRIAFQYIRDHLGYRFQLRSAQIPPSAAIGSTAQIDLKIKNFGFSKLVNSRQAYLVLIDANNNVREIPTGVNAQAWYPTYTQNDGVFDLVQNIPIDNSYATGTYRIGLWLPDPGNDLKYNPAYAIKLANAGVEWWTDPANKYMVNLLTTINITAGP